MYYKLILMNLMYYKLVLTKIKFRLGEYQKKLNTKLSFYRKTQIFYSI